MPMSIKDRMDAWYDECEMIYDVEIGPFTTIRKVKNDVG